LTKKTTPTPHAQKPPAPRPPAGQRSLLDAVLAVTPRNSLDALDAQTRSQVIEVAKAFISGEVCLSKKQILTTLAHQGVPLGRYTFDKLLESIVSGARK
jgi:hypothetical protein